MVWILPDLMAPSTQRVLWLCGLIRVHQPWWFDRWHTDADVPLQICKLMFCPPPHHPHNHQYRRNPAHKAFADLFRRRTFMHRWLRLCLIKPLLECWMIYMCVVHYSGLTFDEQTWCSCREFVALKFFRAMFLLTLFLTVMVHRFWSCCARGLPFGYPTITLNYFLSASLFTGFMHPTTCTFISLLRSKNIW